MSSRRPPSAAQLDRALAEPGVKPSADGRRVLRVLASDATALHATVRQFAALSPPDESGIPDIDAMVERHMRREYKTCIDPSLLRKSGKIGRQNRLLLAYLMERPRQEVRCKSFLGERPPQRDLPETPRAGD